MQFRPFQPTSSYGVPDPFPGEDPKPRLTGNRPPVFGYYPPQQRVMPRVNRKFILPITLLEHRITYPTNIANFEKFYSQMVIIWFRKL